MRVLVLGATGFVGARVVAALSSQPEVEVIAANRAGSRRQAPPGIVQRSVRAEDRSSLQAAMDGITHVVNCVMATPDTMVKGVDLLVEAALHRNVRRIVQISSIAVHGPAEGWLDEASPFGSQLDAYARAKVETETLIRRGMDRGLDSVILRPGLIYGPGSAPWTLRIARLLQQGRLGDLGAAGDGYANLIHIDDVARAIVAALSVSDAQRQVFTLSEPDPPRWNDYLKTFARALGVTPVPRISARQLRFETRIAAIPLKLAERILPRVGLAASTVPPAITPSLAAVMQQEVRFRSIRTDAVLRLHRTSWRKGVEQAAVFCLETR